MKAMTVDAAAAKPLSELFALHRFAVETMPKPRK
jgi:hypothetical protein